MINNISPFEIMKKSLFSIMLVTFMIPSLLTGCNKTDDKSDKKSTEETQKKQEFVYTDEHIKLANYKGLETSSSLEYEVTDEDVDGYIESILSSYYAASTETTESTDETKDENEKADASTETTTEEATTETTTEETSESKQYKASDLTDDMVKEITSNEYTTVNDYRNYIAESIKQENDTYTKNNVGYELFQTVVTNSELVDYEEDVYQKYYDYSDKYYQEYAEYQETDFDTFKKDMLGVEDDEAYKKLLKDEAELNTKTQYVISAIAKNEGLEITDEEVQAEIQNYIEQGNFETEDDVLNYITKEEIRLNLLYEDEIELLFNNAVYKKATTETTETDETTATSEVEQTSEEK